MIIRRLVVLLCLVLYVEMVHAGDKYCVTCGPSSPTGTRPFVCEAASGGEVGRVECGLRNAGCQVTFYDGRVCGPGTFVKSRTSAKQHVKWAISHEGCAVYSGDARRSVSDIRGCIMEKQRHNDEARFQVSSHSDADLDELISESVAEVRNETIQNFSWVCDHERQGASIHALLGKGDLAAIRGTYARFQQHNPNAVNQLAAAPDAFVRVLVQSHCPPTEPEQRRERDRIERPDKPDKPGRD